MTPEEYVAELLWEGSFGDEYRQQIRDEVAQEMRQKVTQEVAQEVRQKVTQEVRREVAQEMRQKVTQEVRREVAREVRQEAVTEGREHFVTALMRDRFGPDPQIPAVARRLLARLEDAPVAHAVVTAADLAALADLVPESAS